ncbi:MAG: N-acetylglucosamine kinase [Syntrophothermus sp.]
MQIFLGVDGGGTKTLWVAANAAGKVFGSGSLGPSNLQVVGEGRLRRLLAEVVHQAESATGCHPGAWQGVCLGLAGVGRPGDRELVEEMLREQGLSRIQVVSDAHVALAGALGGQPGAVVIAGTGSIAYGANAAGATARAGGWGYLLGDEGSGYAIGRAAIARSLQALDGRGAPTGLGAAISAHFGLIELTEIINRVYGGTLDRSEIASLVPLVDKAAADGDQVAGAVLAEAGGELALLAKAVLERLAMPGGAVATVGGVLLGSRGVREAFTRRLAELWPGAAVVLPKFWPAVGAVILAARQAEAVIGEEALLAIQRRLETAKGISAVERR